MCMQALESTANYLTSGSVMEGAGGHQTSAREKNVTLSFFLSLGILFPISHARLHVQEYATLLPGMLQQGNRTFTTIVFGLLTG